MDEEVARRESDGRLRLALELGRMGTGAWDIDRGVAHLDAIAASLYGLDPVAGEVEFSRILALVHPDDLGGVMQRLARLQDTHEAVDIVERIIRPDGELRWLAIRAQRMPAGTGGGRVLGVLFDITERMRIEQRLEQLNTALEQRVRERTAELQAANQRLEAEMRRREAAQAALSQAQKLEALGQVTGSIAHDFNNELMIILGGLDLATKDVGEGRALRHLQNARKAGTRARQLTAQLLSFARREDLEPEVVDVADVLAELEDGLRHIAGSSVEIVLDHTPQVWPAWADRDELHAGLLNLAVNARDAMPDGGKLSIALRNVPFSMTEKPRQLGPGDFVAIRVSDTGTGMTPEVLARATEPFFTTKQRGRGTGLGLASVRGFVEQSNGAIEISSAPGQGTTVDLFLPSAGDAPATAAQACVPVSVRGGDLVVLCVDDNPHALEMTSDLLRDLGYTVIPLGDPEAALRLARSGERMDLLVTDIDMPSLDGVELARRMTGERPGLRVIHVTGHLQGTVPPGTLHKPFTRQQIAARIVAAVSGT